MSKLFYPTVHKSKSKELCNRDNSRRFIEIVTGQNNLNYIKNKILGQNHLCRLCEEEEETFDHFVSDCPCLWQIRREYFGINPVIHTHNWKLNTLLSFSKVPAINAALEDI